MLCSLGTTENLLKTTKRMLMKLLILSLMSFLWMGSDTNEKLDIKVSVTGDLVVKIANLKNTEGQVGILVFNKKDGFPSERPKALRDVLIPITGNTVEYTFTDLPYGQYAVTVMHDANKNRKLDKNILGIPKEGNAVSNNAVGKMGPPKYEKAVFEFQKDKQSIQIKLRY